PTLRVAGSDLQFILMKIVKRTDNADEVIIEPGIMPESEAQERFGISSEAYGNLKRHLEDTYANEDNKATRVIGGSYKTTTKKLVPSLKLLKDLKNQLTQPGEAAAAIPALTEFMNPEKNALVKAFRSTQGKGVAGKIDSLNFDWMSGRWETKVGSRAPQFFKVTLAFSPIHDISPGIDHQGYNRGPVYPVGHFALARDDIKDGT